MELGLPKVRLLKPQSPMGWYLAMKPLEDDWVERRSRRVGPSQWDYCPYKNRL